MRPSVGLTLLCALIAGAACNDQFGPDAWDDTPIGVRLLSASRPELLGLPSAYDAVFARVVRIEELASTSTWDFLLVEEDGEFYFQPAGVIDGIESRAGLSRVEGVTFEGLIEAPSDTATYSPRLVLIEEDGVYVMRTRRAQCPTFGTSVMYGKLLVEFIDTERGFIEMSVVRNPFCDLLELIPPEN